MKKLVGIGFVAMVCVLIMTSVSSSSTPAEGIIFDHGTVGAAKKKAAAKGKLVFIDCYTVWCGPCKRMAATAFVDPEVGKIFNKNFVNIKVEMEKDADGSELARLYKVRAYPTLLIIDSKGKLIKQAVGMQSAQRLIALANAALQAPH
jgi:thioredoxin